MNQKLRFTFVWLSKHPNVSLLSNMLKNMYADDLLGKKTTEKYNEQQNRLSNSRHLVIKSHISSLKKERDQLKRLTKWFVLGGGVGQKMQKIDLTSG